MESYNLASNESNQYQLKLKKWLAENGVMKMYHQ